MLTGWQTKSAKKMIFVLDDSSWSLVNNFFEDMVSRTFFCAAFVILVADAYWDLFDYYILALAVLVTNGFLRLSFVGPGSNCNTDAQLKMCEDTSSNWKRFF